MYPELQCLSLQHQGQHSALTHPGLYWSPPWASVPLIFKTIKMLKLIVNVSQLWEAYNGYNCSTKISIPKDGRQWSLRAWIVELACVGSSAFFLNIILVMGIEACLINFFAIGLWCEQYTFDYASVVWSLHMPFTQSTRYWPIPLLLHFSHWKATWSQAPCKGESLGLAQLLAYTKHSKSVPLNWCQYLKYGLQEEGQVWRVQNKLEFKIWDIWVR